MSTTHLLSLRFCLFAAGQIVMTTGAFALLFGGIPQAGAFAAIVLGGALLAFGGPSLTAQMRTAFPLRVRISLFLGALLLVGLAFQFRRF